MYYLVCSSKQLQGIGVVILILQNRKLKFLPQVLELRTELGAESGTAGALCVAPSTLPAQQTLKTLTESHISLITSMYGISRDQIHNSEQTLKAESVSYFSFVHVTY